MFAPDLTNAIDRSVPPGMTHIGIVLKNNDDAVLVTEPHGHPYGVSATFNKIKLVAGEASSAAVDRCLREQVGGDVTAIYPIPMAWATSNSRSFYFAALFDGQPAAGPHRAIWMSPAEAHQRLSASHAADSRQRDLGLLAAVTDMCLSPHRRVLLMVRELHRMGFEQIRAAPYMYPIAWRCPVIPALWVWREHGCRCDDYIGMMPEALTGGHNRRYTYSSAEGQQPFQWQGVHFATPRQLAERFVHELPQLVDAARAPDQAYIAWYDEMLAQTEPNGVVYAFGEYQDPQPDTLYTAHCRVQRVAAPPPGLTARGAFDAYGERLSRQPGEG